MMPDIFSAFDPFLYNLMPLPLSIILIIFVSSSMWMLNTRLSISCKPGTQTMWEQLSRTMSISLKGTTTLLTYMFILIVTINLMGLIPYSFSTSSHLIFTMSFGLPLWMSFIISSTTNNPKQTMAHFLPDGAPDWLNPFLVLIETTSIMVRPLTLSFRLAANMSAGHIVLILAGTYASASWLSSMSSTIILTSVMMGYILFEVAICMIQGYIFCLLLSLYSDDHSH